jgi:hypothetical protein
MKKLIVGIVIVAFSFINAPVMAASAKVPTNLCLAWSGVGVFTSLAIKNGSNLKTVNGAAKHYTISGNTNWFGETSPFSGSGYVVPGTTDFHATISGIYPSNYPTSLDLYFDLATHNGTIHYNIDNGAGSPGTGAFAVTLANCTVLPLPM